MKHRIDPTIDCVFKALLGADENRNLLVHFLNAMLGSELPAPITAVDILDPFNEREFLADKLSVVDVKARDGLGRLYQVEIQVLYYANLPARIVYNWCDIYSQQLQSGQDYLELKPTYSIWLLGDTLIQDDTEYAHRLKLRDERGRSLYEHGGIYLFELGKFATEAVETEEQRWLRFFKEGGRLDDTALPEWMQTAEMRQAMKTLSGFSEKERNYFAYQAREEYLREQRTIQRELAQAREALREMDTAIQEKDAVLRQKDTALQQKDTALQQKDTALRQKDAALRTAARQLLAMGLDSSRVAQATGLSEDEIEALNTE